MRRILIVFLVATLVVVVAAWAQSNISSGQGTTSGKSAASSGKSQSSTTQSTMSSGKGSSTKPATASSGKSDMAGTTTANGWISDDKCGAKMMGGEVCAKKCIKYGAKAVFVSDSDEHVWSIENPDSIRKHEGHHVTITGHMNKDKSSVHIESLKIMASSTAGASAKPADKGKSGDKTKSDMGKKS